MLGSAAFRIGIAPGGALAGPWVRNPLWTRARAVPSLDLRFADNKSLVDATTGASLVTFTRASTGTYVGSDGLIMAAVTNLLLRSEEFGTTWVTTRASVTNNAIASPFGTVTADLVVEDTSASLSHVVVQGSLSIVAGLNYTFSCYVKRASGFRNATVTLRAASFGNNVRANVDLSTGVVTPVGSPLNSGATFIDNGWWRVWVTATATVSGASSVDINLADGTTLSYTGDGTSGIYLWGAQLEQASDLGDYVPTTSTINSAPRFDHNPTTGESLGLLVEEARTNLSQQSEDFSNVYWTKTDCTITADDSTAPDGTTTADLWTNILSAGGAINNSITKDATARTYTSSMWVKGTATIFTFTLDFGGTTNRGRAQFNLATNTIIGLTNTGNFTNTTATITAYSNGWARLTMTTTTSTGTTIRFRPFFGTGGESVLIWGAQVEEGAFATSYIPTTTATATRAADVASITGANFSSWYNQTEGTVFANTSVSAVAPATSLQTQYAIHDGSADNRITVYKRANADTSARLDIAAATVSSAFLNAGTFGLNNLTASAVQINNFAISLNGLTAVADTAGNLPSVNQMNLGSYVGATGFLNGTIRRLCFWPTRLSNPTLQSITQ